jgi:hypothetical protein
MSRKDPRIKSWAAAVALFLANGLSHANDASVSTYTFPPNEAIRDLLVSVECARERLSRRYWLTSLESSLQARGTLFESIVSEHEPHPWRPKT